MDPVVHFEILMDKPERAVTFYQTVFGWNIESFPGAIPYWLTKTSETNKDGMPKKSGRINGGMYKRINKDDRCVLVVAVSDLDEYTQKITKAGGKVVMPRQEIKDMGYYMKINDTEGNVIGVFEPIMKK